MYNDGDSDYLKWWWWWRLKYLFFQKQKLDYDDGDDDHSETEEEKPVVVVLKAGDLNSQEAAVIQKKIEGWCQKHSCLDIQTDIISANDNCCYWLVSWSYLLRECLCTRIVYYKLIL